MYLAEIHGKLSGEHENKEDILTSNVFSFFKYADRGTFFLRFLRMLHLEVTTAEVQKAEFMFWPTYTDGTQPDVVIVVGKYYLLIEAKLYSSFSPETMFKKHQLVREFEGGALEALSLDKEFRIIAITADYSRPINLDIVPSQYLGWLVWTNWQGIAVLIYQILEKETHLTEETRSFASDLYQLLVKKRLRNFEGTRVLGQTKRLVQANRTVFFEAKTSTYRGDFIGFLNAFEKASLFYPHLLPLFFHQKRLHVYWSGLTGRMSLHPHGNFFFTRSK